MYARVSTLRGFPDQIDEGIRHTRESVLPRAEIANVERYEVAITPAERG